ncbi:MAG: hypothetical protein ACK4NC_03880 [Candidatus Gracilibacteria bacterium]
MKKIFLSLTALFLLTSCGSSTSTAETPDLTNLYAQMCESGKGPCSVMQCTDTAGTYKCAESVAKLNTDCSATKNHDEIMSAYQVCGTASGSTLAVYNYSQKLVPEFQTMTPDELKAKVDEEVQKVEQGGTSPFLQTFLTSVGGAIVGGMIANAIFGRSYAMPPARTASEYSRPIDKNSLSQVKTDAAQKSSGLSQAVTQSKAKAASPTIKKTTTPKKTTTTPRKTIRRR